MAQRIVVDPVTRIEGHLKVEVEVEGGKVVDARSTGALFRGIELILRDRDPRDAQQITQRICGVCPAGHATASTLCLDDAFGIKPPANGRIIRNLILGANYIQSHILHFYHLAALDYVKGPDVAPFIPRYEGDYRLPEPVNAAAVEHYLQALEMRKSAHEMLAIFGGKMPHLQGIVPGGVTETVDAQKVIEFRYRLQKLIGFIDNVYLPDVLAIAAAYEDWFTLGAGCKNMLVYGAFPLDDSGDPTGQNQLFRRGLSTNGQAGELDPDKIHEDVKHSWYSDDTGGSKHPSGSLVSPDVKKENAYSWIKAPRYDGKVYEVGPLARAIVNKKSEIVALGDKAYSVMGRHAARAYECSQLAHAMEEWLEQLVPGDPVCTPHELPVSAEGMGLTEAARGALGHWIQIKGRRIARYNAVVPTTWNASPRDDKDQPGPIEQALIGTPVADPGNPIEVVRIIRSFDPCIACAVHLVVPGRDLTEFRVS